MLNIINNKKYFFTLPIVIILIGIVCFFTLGFNLDIDFAGGSEMVVDLKTPVVKDDISKLFEDTLGFKVSAVQVSLANENVVTVKSKTLTPEESEKLWEAFKVKYTLEDGDRLSVDSVSPTVGKELGQAALVSSIIAVILMLVYISFRFEFLSGVAAIIALIHDVLIMLSAVLILRLPINTTFIAALLTIIGYSINDTIVVFDRIRENVKFARRETFSSIANRSVNATITRSINTSVTTLITVVMLYILGVDSIKDFAITLIVGIVAGTYSSIFIATPVWSMMRKEKKA